MKRIIVIPLLLFSLFLSSCTESNTDTDFIRLGLESVFNDTVIYSINGVVHIMDVTTGANMPICARPNCNHDDEFCSARAVGATSFIHGNSLFLLLLQEGGISLYKGDLNGGNRRRVFTIDTPEKTDETIYRIHTKSNSSLFSDGKLYFLVQTSFMELTDIGTWEQSNLHKHTVYSYEFASDTLTTVYDTDFALRAEWQIRSVSERAISYTMSYNTDENLENIIIEHGYIDRKSSSTIAIHTINELVMSSADFVQVHNDYCYYIKNGNLYRRSLLTDNNELLFEEVLHLEIFDDTLFVYTGTDWSETGYSFMRNGEWFKSDMSYRIYGETKSYFLGVNNSYKAILKSDFYAGIDTSFEIMEAE